MIPPEFAIDFKSIDKWARLTVNYAGNNGPVLERAVKLAKRGTAWEDEKTALKESRDKLKHTSDSITALFVELDLHKRQYGTFVKDLKSREIYSFPCYKSVVKGMDRCKGRMN